MTFLKSVRWEDRRERWGREGKCASSSSVQLALAATMVPTGGPGAPSPRLFLPPLCLPLQPIPLHPWEPKRLTSCKEPSAG